MVSLCAAAGLVPRMRGVGRFGCGLVVCGKASCGMVGCDKASCGMVWSVSEWRVWFDFGVGCGCCGL
jgi:hypothetical protein